MDAFPQAALDEIRRSVGAVRVEALDELPSTSRFTKENAEAISASIPYVVVAERQTAGRGRGENQWHATDGALTFTAVFDQATLPIPLERWPQASLMTAVAVAEALESLVPDESIYVKWPNDIYSRGRKLCGILLERTESPRPLLHLGIGVNVNNSLEGAPSEVRDRAISLTEISGSEFFLPDVLLAILQRMQANFELCASDLTPLADAWRRRCLLSGRKVEIQSGEQAIAGICGGIDNSGALLVDSPGGVRRILAGVVTRF
ncbi:biotin--[acetyl-CoA-carboxylase] ligase [Blastopirellula sp. JC732]|uniref:biotin--[biotin carboxyl-carrier protein] ligase n=1 Tax=Blastopirellula sediminis TaxID=2894196 RepID=A0A9X1MKW8_9BACT|nr:biotin--[acetyl-CoA-carboxylase] ligase [Blastopirellula sediminis]MCC9608752.1 biotin--[acetyl-CoA-carboxylase] ligase [Blastopirellula sediminis]MCC9628471.1 biotin--[acetyl-CoA-carboxylase] ligase [Blastopirellula sediminis]